VYGISQRERDRRQAIAKNVFDALCEKYRDIVELMRNVMPNWGVLVGALFLTCCTVTTAPNLYRVTELIPGISTKDDAIAKLGPPTGTLNAEDQTILQWGGPQSPVVREVFDFQTH
jgi:hypothetical protein